MYLLLHSPCERVESLDAEIIVDVAVGASLEKVLHELRDAGA